MGDNKLRPGSEDSGTHQMKVDRGIRRTHLTCQEQTYGERFNTGTFVLDGIDFGRVTDHSVEPSLNTPPYSLTRTRTYLVKSLETLNDPTPTSFLFLLPFGAIKIFS